MSEKIEFCILNSYDVTNSIYLLLFMVVVSALYQFKDWPDFAQHRQPLIDICTNLGIKGSLLIAAEGINGTVSGSSDSIQTLKTYLESNLGFDRMEYKESSASKHPFFRLKIKLKKEIVTLGKPGEANPNKQVGEYLTPKEWNELLKKPNVVVVDTRNDYEYAVGTFKGALNPQTTSFRQFPGYVENNLDPSEEEVVAMFCTGGIRCEKASSYMLHKGFKKVYHLKGGILKYLEEIPPEESLWEGECFVFDQRVTVSHGLELGHYDTCHGCRMPLSAKDKESAKYEAGVSCTHCYDSLTPDQLIRFRERQKQVELAALRGEPHLGRKSQKSQIQS